MTRPRLLDLFCGAGGAAMGYHRAGFDVVGVDINPQPHYPFKFIRADALEFVSDIELGKWKFDAIHASPPCQAFSRARSVHKADHDDLLTPTRAMLEAQSIPWIIENVVGAPMRGDLMLCGSMFGLPIRRHRLFDSSIDLGWPPFACSCEGLTRRGFMWSLHNAPSRDAYHRRHPEYDRPNGDRDAMRDATGVPWMTYDGAQEAIPPAYTEWIGAQLLAALKVSA